MRDINSAIARLRGSADCCSAAHACLCLTPEAVPRAGQAGGGAAVILEQVSRISKKNLDFLSTDQLQIGSGSTVFPLFGRFRRDCSIEGLAGGAPVPPIVLPVELSLLPDSVSSYEVKIRAFSRTGLLASRQQDLCTALHDANHLCTLLANQSHLLR